MSKYTLVFSPKASSDLKSIYQYGLRHWGKKQSDDYLENLKVHFWMITEQPFIGVERTGLLPQIRSLPIESHILFYRVTSNFVEIIRVLHGRQSPFRHLKL